MSRRNQALSTLAQWIEDAKYTVVLTGAGMSTESGIPDFRSKEGYWKNINPEKVASVGALDENYELFRAFYKSRIEGLQNLSPHPGHHILAKWEKLGHIHAVATQNVDGFHQLAGNQEVYELHGSIRSVRCDKCGNNAEMNKFLEGECCTECSGKLRPNVVLFGELLPEVAWDRALKAITRADLVIVIGTSLQVYPVNQLPKLTKGKVAIINVEATEMDAGFDLVIHGKAGEILREVNFLIVQK